MEENSAIQKLAKILRCDQDTLLDLEKKAEKVSGKAGILEKIAAENKRIIEDRLMRLGFAKEASAPEIYSALIRKITLDDQIFVQKLGNVTANKIEDCQKILDVVKNSSEKLIGYFLKKEKAKELLIKEPPQNVLRALNYSSVSEMVAKEDIFELFASLRFIENNDWLNNIFFKQYENLKAEDFEEREVEIRVLNQKWAKAAEDFVKKKYHNISHLKEFGIIFVIPVSLNIPGEILRMISLVLHYYYEVKFYSDILRNFAKESDFALKLIAILKGDLLDERLLKSEKLQWMIIQQYLAKNDENDWRLFEPHINPEAIHWRKAERDIVKLGEVLNGLEEDFTFWENVNWVGDYFKVDSNNEILVSFNLVDMVMSLVKEKEMVKYLYHHQEALWNKIFIEYFGEEKLEKQIKNNLLKGYIQL